MILTIQSMAMSAGDTSRIAVSGAQGQLGSQLHDLLGPRAWPLDLEQLDITDADAVRRVFLAKKLAAIVNCAAYTAVDRAEVDAERCFAVNATAVEYLARAATELEVPLVQISTDYVYSAVAPERRPWREDDDPEARCVYGRSKLAGERAAEHSPLHVIVRTCGLYGHPRLGRRAVNFVEAILRKAARGEPLRVVNDQECTPTYTRHLAEAVLFLLAGGHLGTYHVTCQGATNWYEFAREVVRLARLEVPITPVTSPEYGAHAARPAYSVLDTAKYHALGGPVMPEWRTALAEYMTWRAERP